jgi:hypothetical protein
MVALHPSIDHKTSPERMASRGKYATAAVEDKAEPGHHQRGWRKDRGGPVGHGGGGGAAALDLVEKEAKQHVVRMVLGGEGWSWAVVRWTW